MVCLHGKTVYGGIADGCCYVLRKEPAQNAPAGAPRSAFGEWERLTLAVSAAREELAVCADSAAGDAEKEILAFHRMMLEDADFLAFLRNAVHMSHASAQNALAQAQAHFEKLFRDTRDDYMIARIDDIRDVCGRVSAFLNDRTQTAMPRGAGILVAQSLLPGDLVRFDRSALRGIVLGSGTVYSHTAILIREMGIPAVICDLPGGIRTGMSVFLNAETGEVYFDPDEKTKASLANASAQCKKSTPLSSFPGKLYINAGAPSELPDALPGNSAGIGLFRTEYLYIGKSELPDEETQFSVYRTLLEKADGKIVTVRTFDIGSDKETPAIPLQKEENPALGFRGLRVYRLFPEIFRTQIRALLRAAVYGNLRILYPMVTYPGEVTELRQLVTRTAQELQQQGIPCRIPPQGAMIETPAAALLSDKIAREADFFSVGTNDLTQYTLAVDRQDGRLDPFADGGREAVFSLIRTAAESAHKNGIEIGICGELAAAPELTEKWIEMGIDSLSVSPTLL